jgi:cation:H+ antiporter
MLRWLAILGLLLLGAESHGRAVDFLWTAPVIIGAAFLVSWGAEAAQFMVSQGLALAILAWLQTLPEFAVEADIAWNAARGTPGYSDHLVTANFTGSIRLIMGFGMPVVYFLHASSRKVGERGFIQLDPFHSVEVVSVFPAVVYFFFIVYRGRLDLLDSIVLLSFYALYMGLLLKMPPEHEAESIHELPLVSRLVLRQRKGWQVLGVLAIFLAGGAALYLCVHPFIASMQAVAVLVGIQGYFFIQWVAPFLSEFPEKVSAFSWARQPNKAKLGLMNFLSSNINQMTMLVAMIPIVYCVSKGRADAAILFDGHQKEEVLLTACQAALCMVLLFNMRFEWWEAVGLFILWAAQFFVPDLRHPIVFVYLAWILAEIALAMLGLRRWSFPLRLGNAPRSLRR